MEIIHGKTRTQGKYGIGILIREENTGGDHWDIGGPKGGQDWWPEGGKRGPKPPGDKRPKPDKDDKKGGKDGKKDGKKPSIIDEISDLLDLYNEQNLGNEQDKCK